MNALKTFFARFRKDERGVTLVEYGIALVLAIGVGGAVLMTLSNGVTSNMGEAGVALAER